MTSVAKSNVSHDSVLIMRHVGSVLGVPKKMLHVKISTSENSSLSNLVNKTSEVLTACQSSKLTVMY